MQSCLDFWWCIPHLQYIALIMPPQPLFKKNCWVNLYVELYVSRVMPKALWLYVNTLVLFHIINVSLLPLKLLFSFSFFCFLSRKSNFTIVSRNRHVRSGPNYKTSSSHSPWKMCSTASRQHGRTPYQTISAQAATCLTSKTLQ